jgi:hypothetical protein
MAKLTRTQLLDVAGAMEMLADVDRDGNHVAVRFLALEIDGTTAGHVIFDEDEDEFVWSQFSD